MCGIVGILGTGEVAPDILAALKRLEYRGYDSAGIATLVDGKIERRRAPGKLFNLEQAMVDAPLRGMSGIGHTRWATHGAPTKANAHPHHAGHVAIVHNGIIENFRELRDELIAEGATGSWPLGCRSGCDIRPTCQSCRMIRPPASCTASVTSRQPSICASE